MINREKVTDCGWLWLASEASSVIGALFAQRQTRMRGVKLDLISGDRGGPEEPQDSQ